MKKMPAKKTASKISKTKNIVVDAKSRKEYSSILEIVKRKIPDAPKTKMPINLRPMLTTLVDEPFTDNEWQFELKLDGYRTLAYLKSGQVDLRSRKNNAFKIGVDTQHYFSTSKRQVRGRDQGQRWKIRFGMLCFHLLQCFCGHGTHAESALPYHAS